MGPAKSIAFPIQPGGRRWPGQKWRHRGGKTKSAGEIPVLSVAPSDIISNLFLEDLERIWDLKEWIPDPCNPHLHYLKSTPEEEKDP